jgi:hypothetical protein
MYEQNETICVSEEKIPVLTREQLEEFSKISLDFLRRYMTDEEVSSIEIEVRFNPILPGKEILPLPPVPPEEVANAVQIGCQKGPPFDATCAPKGGYWGLPKR